MTYLTSLSCTNHNKLHIDAVKKNVVFQNSLLMEIKNRHSQRFGMGWSMDMVALTLKELAKSQTRFVKIKAVVRTRNFTLPFQMSVDRWFVCCVSNEVFYGPGCTISSSSSIKSSILQRVLSWDH